VESRFHHTLRFALWLLGAAAGVAVSLLVVAVGTSGKISALALVPFAWTVALLAGAVHHLPRRDARPRA
jgi:hypothetical protein